MATWTKWGEVTTNLYSYTIPTFARHVLPHPLHNGKLKYIDFSILHLLPFACNQQDYIPFSRCVWKLKPCIDNHWLLYSTYRHLNECEPYTEDTSSWRHIFPPYFVISSVMTLITSLIMSPVMAKKLFIAEKYVKANVCNCYKGLMMVIKRICDLLLAALLVLLIGYVKILDYLKGRLHQPATEDSHKRMKTLPLYYSFPYPLP